VLYTPGIHPSSIGLVTTNPFEVESLFLQSLCSGNTLSSLAPSLFSLPVLPPSIHTPFGVDLPCIGYNEMTRSVSRIPSMLFGERVHARKARGAMIISNASIRCHKASQEIHLAAFSTAAHEDPPPAGLCKGWNPIIGRAKQTPNISSRIVLQDRRSATEIDLCRVQTHHQALQPPRIDRRHSTSVLLGCERLRQRGTKGWVEGAR
jgi:hypothetical protein